MVRLTGRLFVSRSRFAAQGVLLAAWSVYVASAQFPPFDTTRLSDAAQDAQGQVWAISGELREALYRWKGERWELAPVRGISAGAQPLALARSPDGDVLCLWSVNQESQLMTRHSGDNAKVVAKFSGRLRDPALFTDPAGNVWVTERGPDIYRISASGKAERVYSIIDEQFHANGAPRSSLPTYNPVLATLDGRGRVWFWSDGLAGGTNIASLRGVLVFDGQKFEHYSTLTGVPDKKSSVIENKDASHLWLAVLGEGLYEVDISNLSGKVVPEPTAGAFRYIQKIFRAEEDWYLLSGEPWRPVPERSGEGRYAALWRLRNGRWEKVLDGVDSRIEYVRHPARSWLLGRNGLWLGAFGSGPWFIPHRGGEPTLIDWRRAFPLADADCLFELRDGRLLSVAFYGGALAAKPNALLANYKPSPRVQIVNPFRLLVEDSKRRLWGVVASGDKALSEWDGEKWLAHPIPGEFKLEQLLELGVDSLDRIWLTANQRGGLMAIFDPKKNVWDSFASFPQALQAQLGKQENFRLENLEFMAPIFTRDGRISFLTVWWKVAYFDGRTWRQWSRQEIKGDPAFVLDGPPFFNRAGNLSVNIEGQTWEFTEAAGWHTASHEPGPHDRQTQQETKAVTPPPGCEVGKPDSVVRDRQGAYWMTWRNQLWKGIPGLCIPQFALDEHQPFLDSRRLLAATSDARGNAFLRTMSNWSQEQFYVVLKAQAPVPQTSLRMKQESADSASLDFSTTGAGETWFTWRIDGGPWSTPTRERHIKLESLADGRHRIEVAAIDSQLQIDPTPAEATIEIHVDERQQVAALIERLNAPEYATREAAVAALAHHPAALALPMLKAARAAAGAEQRWWIDAAIQQIEENSRKATKQ